MLRRLVPYWLPAWRATLGGAVLLLLASALELLLPWPIKWLVDSVFGSQPAPPLLARLWPPFAERDAAGSVLGIVLAIVILGSAHRLVTLVSQHLLIRSGTRLVLQLRCHLSEHLHRLSLAYHDRVKLGETLYRFAQDSHAAQALLNGALVPSVSGIVILAGILAMMVRIDGLLTVVALGTAPLFWLTIRFFGRRLETHAARYHERESRLVSIVQESLASIRAVQAFTREPETDRRVRAEAGMSVEANDRLTRIQLAFSACVGLAMTCGTAAVVWIGATRVIQGRLWPGDILVFLAYLGMLYQPMNAFSHGATVMQSALAQLRRVFEVLDETILIRDRPGSVRLPAVRGRVELRDVVFAYEAGRTVLRGVSLTAEPGQVVAMVGRSGAGKSTVASLLLRFYDPGRGAVLLDGHDIRDLQLAWLRRQMSIVLQDPVILSSTVRENIAYGRPSATMGEIEEAARQAQAEEFIRRLPHGYDTVLGERGVDLSGGQRQRLAIARAFLKDAPVLVMDEPTAAIDTRTEEALRAALRDLMRGRTTFLIAHRLSIVRDADLIVVLEDGAIVERGSHEALLASETAYRRLCRTQWGMAAL
jgi:ATP-binding cassette subfamily B protein/subfamily B ATP-binding cassette protein MsbA